MVIGGLSAELGGAFLGADHNGQRVDASAADEGAPTTGRSTCRQRLRSDQICRPVRSDSLAFQQNDAARRVQGCDDVRRARLDKDAGQSQGLVGQL